VNLSSDNMRESWCAYTPTWMSLHSDVSMGHAANCCAPICFM